MQKIITKQVSITPLDSHLNICPEGPNAKYQLEKYYTPRSAYAIEHYNGKFSYTIGTQVNVAPVLTLNSGSWLKNIIMNDCITHIREQY